MCEAMQPKCMKLGYETMQLELCDGLRKQCSLHGCVGNTALVLLVTATTLISIIIQIFKKNSLTIANLPPQLQR